VHFKNCVKSTCNREFLKAGRLAKLTEVWKAIPHKNYSSSKESTTGAVVAMWTRRNNEQEENEN